MTEVHKTAPEQTTKTPGTASYVLMRPKWSCLDVAKKKKKVLGIKARDSISVETHHTNCFLQANMRPQLKLDQN